MEPLHLVGYAVLHGVSGVHERVAGRMVHSAGREDVLEDDLVHVFVATAVLWVDLVGDQVDDQGHVLALV